MVRGSRLGLRERASKARNKKDAGPRALGPPGVLGVGDDLRRRVDEAEAVELLVAGRDVAHARALVLADLGGRRGAAAARPLLLLLLGRRGGRRRRLGGVR